eukprot:1151673-Pelagomonas_calceolata.AAC.5
MKQRPVPPFQEPWWLRKQKVVCVGKTTDKRTKRTCPLSKNLGGSGSRRWCVLGKLQTKEQNTRAPFPRTLVAQEAKGSDQKARQACLLHMLDSLRKQGKHIVYALQPTGQSQGSYGEEEVSDCSGETTYLGFWAVQVGGMVVSFVPHLQSKCTDMPQVEK